MCCEPIREFGSDPLTDRFTFELACAMNQPAGKEPSAWIAIDGGSTNTRAWLLHAGQVVARASAGVGVRDTAREGSPQRLRAAVRDLIARTRSSQSGVKPSLVAAAGMITSPLGLAEVPHVVAPASAEDLARGVVRATFPELADLPFRLFPGVRCGDLSSDGVSQVDLMRGEETLCVGLLRGARFQPPFTLLNLGSHWKLIRVNASGRIAQSRTSLSGELIHATQTTTILASGLPGGKLERLDKSWCERGMTELRRSGLSRSLFCVRLLEMQNRTAPEERMSFLIGAYVAAELESLCQAGRLAANESVILAGSGAVAEAWAIAFELKRVPTQQLSEAGIETAFIAGLARLVRETACSG